MSAEQADQSPVKEPRILTSSGAQRPPTYTHMKCGGELIPYWDPFPIRTKSHRVWNQGEWVYQCTKCKRKGLIDG